MVIVVLRHVVALTMLHVAQRTFDRRFPLRCMHKGALSIICKEKWNFGQVSATSSNDTSDILPVRVSCSSYSICRFSS